MEKLEHFRKELEAEIESFGRSRHDNKAKAARVVLADLFIAGLITLLMAIPTTGGMATAMKVCVAALAWIATVVRGWDRYFAHRELWILYTKAWNELRLIRSDLEFWGAGGSIRAEQLSELRQRYRDTVQGVYSAWLDLRGWSEKSSKGKALQKGKTPRDPKPLAEAPSTRPAADGEGSP